MRGHTGTGDCTADALEPIVCGGGIQFEPSPFFKLNVCKHNLFAMPMYPVYIFKCYERVLARKVAICSHYFLGATGTGAICPIMRNRCVSSPFVVELFWVSLVIEQFPVVVWPHGIVVVMHVKHVRAPASCTLPGFIGE